MSMLGIVSYCIDSIVCSVIVVVIFNIFVVVFIVVVVVVVIVVVARWVDYLKEYTVERTPLQR